MRILAVDDDATSLETIKAALSGSSHEIVTARNGEEAAYVIFKSAVHMVLTDRAMPGMDGLELCRWIRSRGVNQYIYVIMMTERAETADIIEGLTAGADEYLSKPIDATELGLRISTGERILSNEHHQVTIFTLAKLAESRDPETGLHLDRIKEYSRILGVNLAQQKKFSEILPYAEIENICFTSVLHDIGKVGIPDTILLKPGKLEPAEFEIMKTHTIIGGKTLGQALAQYPEARFLEIARNIAFWHHEWFDGSGYPHGLTGEDIPLCGRIVALADVYDAITSKRPYKKALPHETAQEIILEKRSRHLDPDVVDAFIESSKEFSEIAVRLAAVESQIAAAPAASRARA